MDKPTFVEEEIPHGRSGSTVKGAGIWQVLVKDFIESGLRSAKVNIGERDYKQAYASLAHAIKVMELRDSVRAVRRNAVESVYLQRIPVASETPKNGNGNGNGHSTETVTPQSEATNEAPRNHLSEAPPVAGTEASEEDGPQSNVA